MDFNEKRFTGGKEVLAIGKISRISSQGCSDVEDTWPESQTPFEAGELWGKCAHITVKSLSLVFIM